MTLILTLYAFAISWFTTVIVLVSYLPGRSLARSWWPGCSAGLSAGWAVWGWLQLQPEKTQQGWTGWWLWGRQPRWPREWWEWWGPGRNWDDWRQMWRWGWQLWMDWGERKRKGPMSPDTNMNLNQFFWSTIPASVTSFMSTTPENKREPKWHVYYIINSFHISPLSFSRL